MTRLDAYRGTFRIDDISVNTDAKELCVLAHLIHDYLPSASILLAVSPMVHDVSREPAADRERAFPRILSAMSDPRVFYRVERAGVPDVVRDLAREPHVRIASLGLVHVDHRLMSREAQELSIVASCSLAGARVFVPPWNKWNRDTEAICGEHGIDLVKFEDGWRHVRFNKFSASVERYYLHTHDTSAARLGEWLACS